MLLLRAAAGAAAGAARLDGGIMWRSILVSLLGELGDKTFYIIIVFSAWCPWQGLRSGGQGLTERCLVFAGASAAFNVRAVLLASLGPMQWGCWPTGLSCLALAVLGTKAEVERRRAAEEDAEALVGGKEAPPEGARSETIWNRAAFSSFPSRPMAPAEKNPFAPAAAERNPFGAGAPEPGPAAEGEPRWNSAAFAGAPPRAPVAAEACSFYGTAAPLKGRRLMPLGNDEVVSVIIAFPASFALVFAMESDDKSEAALLLSHWRGPDVVIGAIAGFLPAAALAVGLGHVLERQLGRQQCLFLVMFLLFSLSLISMSQALLHLSALQPAAVIAALQLGARALRGGASA